ncbi:MAG: 2-dehydropantoate 2-reductase, partial [Phycisphaerae bacterium]
EQPHPPHSVDAQSAPRDNRETRGGDTQASPLDKGGKRGVDGRPGGELTLRNVDATDKPATVGSVDFIILGVKTWQVQDAADVMRPLLGPETAILPLQNGVEVSDQLSEVLGRKHVLGGACRIIAYKTAPNRITHVGVKPYIAVGELDNHKSARVETLVRALLDAGISGRNPPDIHVAVWNKFLFFAPVSGVGSVTRSPLGVIRTVPPTRQLVLNAMNEVRRLAAAKGVKLADDAVEKTMAFLDGMPPEGTTSVQRDIIEGRPSELEAVSGAVVRISRDLGVDTPTHDFIYAALLPAELEARRIAARAGARQDTANQ